MNVNRQIIVIDEAKCTGCGQCVHACHEGVIAMVNGKARIVKESACDGLGSCLNVCPEGAIRLVEEKEEKGQACPHTTFQKRWPIQLALLAPWVRLGQEIVIAADCTAFQYPFFHDALRGRRLLIACPKLDEVEVYEEKLRQLFTCNILSSIEVIRMEVPCCFGLVRLVEDALRATNQKCLFTITPVSINGEIIGSTSIAI